MSPKSNSSRACRTLLETAPDKQVLSYHVLGPNDLEIGPQKVSANETI